MTRTPAHSSADHSLAHTVHRSILRAYDIRGVVGETLFVDDALAIGRAFATTVIELTHKPQPVIALGWDGRLSTPELREAFIEGAISTGATVQDYGLGATPMLYFAVYHDECDAGVMITGSHNPKHHNGFKMMIGKQSFFGDDIAALGERMSLGDVIQAKGGKCISAQRSAEYANKLASAMADNSATRALRVVIDPGNGAAGDICKILVEQLPATITLINETIDGNFPNHHPDPTVPANMQQLIEAVHDQNADFGIAFDGDADRIGAVDNQGRILYGDQLMQLFAWDVLQRHPGATIIADVKASQSLFDVITSYGGTPLMWKTGHSLVKAKMKESGALLAGEMSGHIFFADEYFGYDDGIYSAVRLMNLVAQSGKPLEQWLDEMPTVHNTPEIRIDVPEEQKFDMVEQIKANLAAADDKGSNISLVDGIRVSNNDGWWLARASNTQAAIIVRAEGKSPDALERVKAQLNEQLQCVDLSL